MKTKLVILVTLACILPAWIASGQYDFFSGARYPGGIKKPGVDLYKVKQDGGQDAEGYQRRVVTWWPRKGVDSIEVKKGMPLRTWTLRDRKLDATACLVHPQAGTEELYTRLHSTQPRTFKAHIVGFRGIGNEHGDSFGFLSYYCPAVVLRLPDGTKRCFTRGSFVKEDEVYILNLFLKEMKQVRTKLSNLKYELKQRSLTEWPNNAKPGEPGTMRIESEHFVWVSGSQHAPNEDYSPWVNRDEPEKARLYREGAAAFGEYMWAYQEYAGVLMPYWNRQEQHKYEVTVAGTYKDGYQWIKGYSGGGYGACGIKHAGGGPWSHLLMHEWGHGLPMQARGQNGEIYADACVVVDDPARMAFDHNIKHPYRHTFHASYPAGLFYALMGDDPNWGYAMAITLPTGLDEKSYFYTLARLGEQRGLFPNGVRGAGDMMGEFTARLAEFDCELQDNLRRTFVCVKRNYLEPVNRKTGLYRIPWAESPEAFGSNIIRLVPEKGAAKLSVDLHGFYDPDTYGDWRACIVAVGADGKARYSPLWNKGVMEMEIAKDDRRFWLTVAATPWALSDATAMYVGRHAYRYPYEVKLSGCRPGTPHSLPGDTDDYELTHVGLQRGWQADDLCMLPHPGDTPEADIMRKTIPPLRARLDTFMADIDRYVLEEKIDTKHWWFQWRLMKTFNCMKPYVDKVLEDMKGARHPNGGGWVAASAKVAPTAYVGPDAMVLDGAKVLDNAVIDDYAVVRGSNIVVSGHAKISGQACVSGGKVVIGGYTRVIHPIDARDKDIVPHEVPLRPHQEPESSGTLWANYAMDRDENELLEDWFRYKHCTMWDFYVLNLNGHLYGQPEFVVDGSRRGFHFNGHSQYAETSPLLADLGEITVELALKWEGGQNQAVFDFGSSPDNCFVFTPAGASGKAELIIILDGKTNRVVADVALAPGKWSECRIEMDGKNIVLWIDGRKAAEKQSTFHPADVFPAGVEKRNFIAAARSGNAHFKGSLDYLRVWHTVYDDFTKAPRPRRHAPRRVDSAFIKSSKAEYSSVTNATSRRDALIQAKLDENPMGLAFYNEISARIGPMLDAIANQASPALTEANRSLKESEQALQQRKREIGDAFDKLSDTDKKQTTRNAYIATHALISQQKVNKAQMAVGTAVKQNIARYAPEHNWLHNLEWIVNSKHYNYPFKNYIRDEVARKIGIKVQLSHENFGSLESLCKAQSKSEWHTRCDWEWRLPQEVDGSIDQLPLLQKWVKKARKTSNQ